MSKLNRLLLLALVAQIGVFIAVGFAPQKEAKIKAQTVLTFDAAKVVKLHIVDGTASKKDAVVLAKKGKSWVVASAGEYPVEGSKVGDVLGKLAALKAGEPVATKAAHHRALEVHADRFQRKVTIELSDGKTQTFFLGSSPGLKKAHFRFDGKADVLAVQPLSAWDLGGTPSSWVDTKYFSVDREAIAAFTLKNAKGMMVIARNTGKWTVVADEGGPTPELDQTLVDSLVSTFSSMYLRVPVGKESAPAHGLDKPSAVLEVKVIKKPADKTASPGSQPTSRPTEFISRRLVLGAKADGAYYAKSATSPFVVQIDNSSAKELVEKKLDDLEKKADAAKAKPPGMPMMPPGAMPGGIPMGGMTR